MTKTDAILRLTTLFGYASLFVRGNQPIYTYIYIYVCVCIYKYICIYIYIFFYGCMYNTYIYIETCVSVSIPFAGG